MCRGLGVCTGLALFNRNLFGLGFFFFKPPPCFAPMSIVSEASCCFQILARLLGDYCVKFKGQERDEIIMICSTL